MGAEDKQPQRWETKARHGVLSAQACPCVCITMIDRHSWHSYIPRAPKAILHPDSNIYVLCIEMIWMLCMGVEGGGGGGGGASPAAHDK